jgi:hypothetical protein
MTLNQHTTRKQRIDRQLNRAGCEVGNLAQAVEEVNCTSKSLKETVPFETTK